MMTTVRQAILEGTKAAVRLHDQLGVRKVVEERGGSVDVFGALLALKMTLLFRPLDGLLGAYLSEPAPGVIISTQRPLRIQRFTGAHELGHIVMGHKVSLDGEEILRRSPTGTRRNLDEVAADAFAGEFLIPKWLLQCHARRQGWNRTSVIDPAVVYQLALRVGASYEATCWALNRNQVIDEVARERLLKISVQEIKVALLGEHELGNWYPDVWVLTERDEGLTIEGQPDDVFVLKLTELGGAGYLWNIDGLAKAGFAILRDLRDIPPPDKAVGGPVTRALTARHSEPARGQFALELRRPWQKASEPLSTLHITYELFGKEVGMPRAMRRQLMAA